jgi:DNA-binding MarR family transcriptional regulator
MPHLEADDYRLLAEFRRALRRFMRFSESAAEKAGLTAQHYQVLLALRAAAPERLLTINDLAQELLIRHNSAVGLVDRLSGRGLIERVPSPIDRRRVHLRLTTNGHRLLERLAEVHQEELRRIGPQLAELLQRITHATASRGRQRGGPQREARHPVPQKAPSSARDSLLRDRSVSRTAPERPARSLRRESK